MSDVPPLIAPASHVDFVLDPLGQVASTGPGAAEWLEHPGSLDRVRQVMTRVRQDPDAPTAWWAACSPIHLRFVPMDSANGRSVLVTVVPTRPELAEALELLTPTQRVVAEYAAAGATVAEIASATDRQPETIRTHVKEIYRRLSICTRLELQWLMRRPAISFER